MEQLTGRAARGGPFLRIRSFEPAIRQMVEQGEFVSNAVRKQIKDLRRQFKQDMLRRQVVALEKIAEHMVDMLNQPTICDGCAARIRKEWTEKYVGKGSL